MSFITRVREVLSTEDEALQFEDRWYRWSAFRDCSTQVGDILDSSSVASSTACMILLRNRPAGVAGLIGLLSSGHRPVLETPIQPTPSLVGNIQRLQPAVFVAEEADWTEPVRAAAASCGAVGLVLSDRGDHISVAHVQGLEKLRAGPHYAAPEHAAIVIPTSGTTGPPKRIPLTEDKLERYVPSKTATRSGPPRTIIIAAPLVTITGLNPFLTWLCRPLRLALLERLDVRKWARLVQEHRPREGGLPPAAMRMLLDSDVPRDALSSLEGWYTGAAPVDPETADLFEAEFKLPVLLAYGATEFGGPVSRMTLADRRTFGPDKRRSSGRALPDVEVRVRDESTGEILGPGHRGILEVKTARAVVRDEEGWTRTNDLAVIDADGFIYIEGRADDVIIRGGFKVPLFEVEAALNEHPDVVDAAATSVADSRLGQVPVALVVTRRPDREFSIELEKWVRDRLAPYKVPVAFHLVETLPRNASMKVSRPELRTLAAQLQIQSARSD